MPALSAPRLESGPGLRAFFRIMDAWNVARSQRGILLGVSDRSIDRWKNEHAGVELRRDQFERLSYLLGIYAGLHAILAESALADDWVTRVNSDFGNRAPLDVMLGGNVGDLADVHRYVEAWRAGW